MRPHPPNSNRASMKAGGTGKSATPASTTWLKSHATANIQHASMPATQMGRIAVAQGEPRLRSADFIAVESIGEFQSEGKGIYRLGLVNGVNEVVGYALGAEGFGRFSLGPGRGTLRPRAFSERYGVARSAKCQQYFQHISCDHTRHYHDCRTPREEMALCANQLL